MRPQTDPARRCLPVSDWPDADRAAWHAALCTDDPLSFERSTAASWKPATCHKNRRGYGRWLSFLRNSGEDLLVSLADRVTRERVALISPDCGTKRWRHIHSVTEFSSCMRS
jgi:hypothetical protein